MFCEKVLVGRYLKLMKFTILDISKEISEYLISSKPINRCKDIV